MTLMPRMLRHREPFAYFAAFVGLVRVFRHKKRQPSALSYLFASVFADGGVAGVVGEVPLGFGC